MFSWSKSTCISDWGKRGFSQPPLYLFVKKKPNFHIKRCAQNVFFMERIRYYWNYIWRLYYGLNATSLYRRYILLSQYIVLLIQSLLSLLIFRCFHLKTLYVYTTQSKLSNSEFKSTYRKHIIADLLNSWDNSKNKLSVESHFGMLIRTAVIKLCR